MPTTAEAFAQALSHHRAGELQEAEALYRLVLRTDPRHAEALHFLGVAAHQRANHSLAEKLMKQSLALQPLNAALHGNLGAVFAALGQHAEAIACGEEGVRLRPDSSETHYRLGQLHEAQGELQRAVACYRESLRIQPDSAEAQFSLGNALLRLGDPEGAARCYTQAARLQPGHAEAHSNLGIALFDLGRMPEAAASYERALAARPNFPEALNNLGNALKELGRLDDAIARYAEALRLRPDFADASGNLANALTVRGELPEALSCYRRALELRPELAGVRSNYLLCLNYDPNVDPKLLFEEHVRWGELHGCSSLSLPRYRNNRNAERPLRVGYLAADFQATAFACFLEPILTNHDRCRVQAVCYQLTPVPERIGAPGEWRAVRGKRPAEIAELVRADGIDILVDLLGHTRGNSLPALPYRPAPVQVTWLGYPNTTGLACVDYRLTDAVADPPGEPVRHTEELVRLPVVFCCYGPPPEAPAVNALPALREGRFTFGSHHNLAKLNPAVLDLWCRVLNAVPVSRILVFRDTLRGSVPQRVLSQFTARGVSADRVVFALASAADHSYLRLYHDVDMVLDSFPWSGHTTTCDALWMGVPVLTLRGTRHAARMATSVLTAVGLPQFVAADAEDFVSRAMQIAADSEGLAHLRARLRQMMAASPVCDAASFTHGLEDTYRAMWARWVRESPS